MNHRIQDGFYAGAAGNPLFRWVCALACFAAAQPARALVWYTNNTVISTTINDNIRVGNYYAGQAPTVTLTNGGVINGGVLVDYGTFNIAGGVVNIDGSGTRLFQNYDTVNLSAGSLGTTGLYGVLQNYYHFNMTGGTVVYEARNESGNDFATMNLTGGFAYRVNVEAGTADVRTAVYTVLTGGTGEARMQIGSTAYQFNITGISTNRVFGGLQQGGFIIADGGARYYLYGTNLTATQTSTNVAAFNGFFDIFRLSGRLADGTMMRFSDNMEFYRKVGSTVSLQLINTNISYPVLAATLANGTNLNLAWRSPSWGYTLQSATNLNAAVWTTVTAPVSQANSNHVVTVPKTNSQAFYRLVSR